MKRTLALICLTAVILAPAKAQVRFAPEAGLNISNMEITPPGSFSVSRSTLSGLRIGGVVDAGINDHIYIQTGAYFTMKGNKRTFLYRSSDTLSETVNETLRINYVEIPGMVVYKTGQPGNGRFFCGLGVAIAYAVGGEDKLDDIVNHNSQVTVNHFDEKISSSVINTFDIAMNATAGYETGNGIFLRVFYTMGMNNISKVSDESDKNRVIGVAVGWYLGKKIKKQRTEDIMFE